MEEILDNYSLIKSDLKPIITKSQGTFRFAALTVDVLAEKFEAFLVNKGYKLEAGTKIDGRYGKGNKILRLLFGAFVKRFAWQITITNDFGITELTFYKEAKGYAGGIIGVSQVNNEFNSIINSLVRFHASLEQNK